jgi:hypothetical protein
VAQYMSHKIREAESDKVKAILGDNAGGCAVRGAPESENGDGSVNFRVDDCGVYLRQGDLVRVPKDAIYMSEY